MNPIEDIRGRYTDRLLDLLERAAQVLRLLGFNVPAPHPWTPSGPLQDVSAFWWTDAEGPKHLQLQFHAKYAATQGSSGEVQISFCIFDLATGRILGCQETKWFDPSHLEEVVAALESGWPATLAEVHKIVSGRKPGNGLGRPQHLARQRKH